MTNFIGILEQNEKTTLVPYNKTPSGKIHIHDELIEFKNKIISIRFTPHIDTPSGAIQVLLQDEDNRILLTFMWIYRKLLGLK